MPHGLHQPPDLVRQYLSVHCLAVVGFHFGGRHGDTVCRLLALSSDALSWMPKEHRTGKYGDKLARQDRSAADHNGVVSAVAIGKRGATGAGFYVEGS